MRKSTLAIAIAAALAAPMAAQADTTLYGQAHASIDFLSADDAPGSTGDDSGVAVANNSSRIGVKGSHKLSEGLSAVYQMEWGVGLDGSGSSLSQRNRIVGLKGGFGTFVMGRHDTPFKVIGRKADLFWSTQLGQNRSLTNPADGSPASWDFRSDNVIGYISPNFGPAHVFAAYITDHKLGGNDSTVSEDNDFDAFSIALILGGGKKPYFLGLGYETHNIDGTGLPPTASDSETAVRVTGTYKFGPVKLAGFYQDASDQAFVDGSDRTVYGLGADFTAGSNTFKAQWYTADANDLVDTAGGDDGADLFALGWDHKLSKSTSVYAQYASLSNNNEGTFRLGGAGHGETATPIMGGDADGFSAGIRVKF